MDLSNISEIKEVNWAPAANKLIKEGWVLLAVAGGQDDDKSPLIIYALGKPGTSA